MRMRRPWRLQANKPLVDRLRFSALTCVGLGVAVLVGTVSPGLSAETAAYPVAGLEPSHRPTGAPVIKKFIPSEKFKKDVFHGVTHPYPPSIEPQLHEQGAWYTPFNRPGMTPPYDIRHWHVVSEGR